MIGQTGIQEAITGNFKINGVRTVALKFTQMVGIAQLMVRNAMFAQNQVAHEQFLMSSCQNTITSQPCLGLIGVEMRRLNNNQVGAIGIRGGTELRERPRLIWTAKTVLMTNL